MIATLNDSALVSAAWLHEKLNDPGIVILDATWTAKGTVPTGTDLYRERHIPGARRFDIDLIANHASALPHMLPTPEEFAAEIGLLGIGDDDLVICYDATGMASAASRCWWMFRVFGYDNVKVLDGGLPRWLAAGYPLDSGEPAPPRPKSFAAAFRPDLVRDLGTVKQIAEGRSDAVLVDARAAGRFEGSAPEPWAGGRSGHIPNSRSLPFTDLVDPESKTLLPRDQLRHRLGAAGLIDAGAVVASCGSGVTACVIALALAELGRPDVAIYDGSWAEWGSHPELPASQGQA
jgi:thiosulfate/3-mercaptopyruvate sulfurtransferase